MRTRELAQVCMRNSTCRLLSGGWRLRGRRNRRGEGRCSRLRSSTSGRGGTTGLLVVACFAPGTGVGLAASTRRLRRRDFRDLGDDCAPATDVEEEVETTLVCEAANTGKGGVLGR